MATAQGKEKIEILNFFRQGKHGEFAPKKILHRKFTFNTGKNLKFSKLKNMPELWWDVPSIF